MQRRPRANFQVGAGLGQGRASHQAQHGLGGCCGALIALCTHLVGGRQALAALRWSAPAMNALIDLLTSPFLANFWPQFGEEGKLLC